MAKLKRQVRRTKEILSANSDAPFSVEELHEGRDFQASVSRADFEALADKVGGEGERSAGHWRFWGGAAPGPHMSGSHVMR